MEIDVVEYKVITSGYKDYVSFCLGDTEIVQIKTKGAQCGWVSQELNCVVTAANSYANAMPKLAQLRGIEAWIGDRQMKELFQKILYSILDRYEAELTRNFQPVKS